MVNCCQRLGDNFELSLKNSILFLEFENGGNKKLEAKFVGVDRWQATRISCDKIGANLSALFTVDYFPNIENVFYDFLFHIGANAILFWFDNGVR